MFGMMEGIFSFIRRQVGLRTDAANAAGSLHAKVAEARTKVVADVADIKSNVSLKTKKPRCVIGGVSNLQQGTTYTVLNVSGRGKLTYFKIGNAEYDNLNSIQIIVDGVINTISNIRFLEIPCASIDFDASLVIKWVHESTTTIKSCSYQFFYQLN